MVLEHYNFLPDMLIDATAECVNFTNGGNYKGIVVTFYLEGRYFASKRNCLRTIIQVNNAFFYCQGSLVCGALVVIFFIFAASCQGHGLVIEYGGVALKFLSF